MVRTVGILPPTLERMKQLGFAVFTKGNYNLNLFGIRSKHRGAGRFDDLLGCAYRVDGSWFVRYWPATTDPSKFWLEKGGASPKGCAILVGDKQYRGAYEIGLHKGQYEALVQTGNRVSVYRDSDRDDRLSFDSSTIEDGYFGINVHAPSTDPYNKDVARDTIGPYSAGCMVHATTTGFKSMMNLCRLQESTLGYEKYTFTLLNQWW